jgi:serine/threonine protein kinase
MKLCLLCNEYFDDVQSICPTDKVALQHVEKDPLIGALISDRYVIESVIGKGSSAVVYKASRIQRGEYVAVKVFLNYLGADATALDRFLREATAASKLRNPHIITIWDFGVTDDGKPFFVMDYLEGLTLSRLVRQRGYLHPSRVMPIVRQIAEALSEAHKQGIVHRDLKPENIVLQETDSGEDYVKILDFGIAESPADAPRLEKPKTVAGSPAYMSPEQCQGFELDHRSDIYSLGIVVFEMLTGVRPFHAEEHVSLMFLHVSQAPMKLSQARKGLKFPNGVEAVIARALGKNPSDRQSSVKDFYKDLEAAWKDSGQMALWETKSKADSSRSDQFSLSMGDRLVDGHGGVSSARRAQDTADKPVVDLAPAEAVAAFQPNSRESAAQVKVATMSLPPVSVDPGNGAGKVGQTVSGQAKVIDFSGKDRVTNKDTGSGFTPVRRSSLLAGNKGADGLNQEAATTGGAPAERPSPFKGMAKAVRTLVAYSVQGNEELKEQVAAASLQATSDAPAAEQKPPQSLSPETSKQEGPASAPTEQAVPPKKRFSITKQDMLAPHKSESRVPTLHVMPQMPAGKQPGTNMPLGNTAGANMAAKADVRAKAVSSNLQKRIQQNVQESLQSQAEPPHRRSFSLPPPATPSISEETQSPDKADSDQGRRSHPLEQALESAAQLHMTTPSPAVPEQKAKPAQKSPVESSEAIGEGKSGLANLLSKLAQPTPAAPKQNNFALNFQAPGPAPTPAATAAPAPAATAAPTPAATAAPTPKSTPTPVATAASTPAPKSAPTPAPTSAATPVPAKENSAVPTQKAPQAPVPDTSNPGYGHSTNAASQTMPPRPGITMHSKSSKGPADAEGVQSQTDKSKGEAVFASLSEIQIQLKAQAKAALASPAQPISEATPIKDQGSSPAQTPLRSLDDAWAEAIQSSPQSAKAHLPEAPSTLADPILEQQPVNHGPLSTLDDAWKEPAPCRPPQPPSTMSDPILGTATNSTTKKSTEDGSAQSIRIPSTFNRLIEAAKKGPKISDSQTIPPNDAAKSGQPLFNSPADRSQTGTVPDLIASSSLPPTGAQSLARLNGKDFSEPKPVTSELDAFRNKTPFPSGDRISLNGAQKQAASEMIQELARDATRPRGSESSGGGAGSPAQSNLPAGPEVPPTSTLPPGFMLVTPAPPPNRKPAVQPVVPESPDEHIEGESDEEYYARGKYDAVAKDAAKRGKNKQSQGHGDKRHRTASLRLRGGGPGLANGILIGAITISVLGTCIVLASRNGLVMPNKEIDVSLPRNAKSIKALLDQKDYKQVRKILEKKQQAGSLSKQESDDLDTAYVNIAKEDFKAKKYDEAYTIARKISQSSPRFSEVARLIKTLKRYRRTNH